jgi:hypothetical protein
MTAPTGGRLASPKVSKKWGMGVDRSCPFFRCASLPTAAVANRLPTPHQRGHRSSNEQRPNGM